MRISPLVTPSPYFRLARPLFIRVCGQVRLTSHPSRNNDTPIQAPGQRPATDQTKGFKDGSPSSGKSGSRKTEPQH